MKILRIGVIDEIMDLHTLQAVSYTHLDVYKRQLYIQLCKRKSVICE